MAIATKIIPKTKTESVVILLSAITIAVTACGQQEKEPSIFQDVPYALTSKNPNNPAQTLDLIVPQSKKPLPLIIYIHGGSWIHGDKQEDPAISLTENGFAVASLNYRLATEAKFPAPVSDCRAAINYLRANAVKYNINPHAIGLFGSSAGGHLVSLLGLSDDVRVQAVCDWSGITDLQTLSKQTEKDHGLDKAVAIFLGGSPQALPEVAAAASPVTHVNAKAPPFLIMHGDQDEVVPLAQSQELANALKEKGADIMFVIVKDGQHNLYTDDNVRLVNDFFEKKLKQIDSLVSPKP